MGEWIIKKLPLIKHIYSAAKQVSQLCLGTLQELHRTDGEIETDG